jgi:hypothetical protein
MDSTPGVRGGRLARKVHQCIASPNRTSGQRQSPHHLSHPLHRDTGRNRNRQTENAMVSAVLPPFCASLSGASAPISAHVATTVNVGKAMIRVALSGYSKRILETYDINALAPGEHPAHTRNIKLWVETRSGRGIGNRCQTPMSEVCHELLIAGIPHALHVTGRNRGCGK